MKNNTPAPCAAPLKYHERARLIFRSAVASTERLVLLAVADHLGSSGECWPSLPRLASMTGLNERTIRRSLSNLRESGCLTVTRQPGRANRYSVSWDALSTLDTVSPRTESHPGQKVQGTPDSVSPTPDSVSTHPGQRVHRTVKRTDQEAVKRTTPPNPLQGDDSGDEVEQASKPTPKKRRTSKSLTVDEVCALDVPSELLALDGYSETFRLFTAHRIETLGAKGRMSAHAVKLIHSTMLKGLAAGCSAADLVVAFEKSIMSNWTGVFPAPARKSYGSAATPDCPLADSRTAWEQALGGLRQTDGHQTPGDVSGWWLYRADSRAHDALAAALVEATGCQSFSLAWRHLRLCDQFEQNRIMGAFRRCWATHWGKHAAEPQTDCLDRANSRTATAQAAEQVAA
jgi:hypothetical protein